MSVAAIIAALALSPEVRVDQRVPKKLLAEQAAPTAADRRQIQDGIEELLWIAALKPTSIGVPAYRDDVREYLEVAVLSVVMRPAAKVSRITELIHRAIPYPVLLLSAQADGICVSLAHKRFSEGEAGKVVVEGVHKTAPLRADGLAPNEAAFLASLALSRLPSRDMLALYQGWIDCVSALAAARITGAFGSPASPEQAGALRANLDAHAQLQRDLAVLRTQAAKEKQLNRRVELNLQVKRLEAELSAVTKNMGLEHA